MPSLQTALPPELANNVIRVTTYCVYRILWHYDPEDMQFPHPLLHSKSGNVKMAVLSINARKLYRECLRRAKYVGSRQHNTELVVDMVRQQFRKHMHETNPDKIQKLKDDAARGLINHILYESEKMSGRKFSQNS
ncbi:hypothetical protein RHSIM_Rhsim04G0245400 [Rhododendron simsii]|uniref:Complex 1 LYR protein domain-containing protein n=1 Tax=Rhododendron simsii TaxID=118357 RepID=A0A834LSK6_RHOSS|nr:hypothetical protein RHSIM_Rhsim04G0245400 [Rhododendron simsii]